jgi:hypothetical protein
MARQRFTIAAAIAAALFLGAAASPPLPASEQKIFTLLNDARATYVSLPEADFRSLGSGFTLPDGGRAITALAEAAPGGAFDPRDVARIPAATLGYKADWAVERYRHYNLDWDITGLKLTSNDPNARNYPWLIVINGGAANFYEFFIDVKNRPGWAQYLAQKLNMMIVTIPGNFKYGGWPQPVADVNRQPAYLLDRELPMAESEMRHLVYTNTMIMHGLEALIMNHTQGDILIVGHSTSGELAMLAYEDPELRARLKGRYLGWGSGGPARVNAIQAIGEGIPEDVAARGLRPLEILERRNPTGYSNGYSGVLNPWYEPGMTMFQVAEKWLAAEGRRRANFKQQLQNWEHAALIQNKANAEVQIDAMLKKTGNPWGIVPEDVMKDLYVTHYTRMDGYSRMVWMTARWDTNHWDPQDASKSTEIVFANAYRNKNPGAEIRLINWDLRMTHYGHIELPRELAGATYATVLWLMR